jgi:DNA-3-methyladenine glycosylase I
MDTTDTFPDGKSRCSWVTQADIYIDYHDTEWGVPTRDDIAVFERISLEGFQAGLSWLTILRKREAFRAAFQGFDFEQVARFAGKDVERLLLDAGIVRHRGKIEAVINNAQRAVELRDEVGSLAEFLWRYEPDAQAAGDSPRTEAAESKALSKELKRRGWKFVGPTTMYALMQALGMVNDHGRDCYCRKRVETARKAFRKLAPAQ